MGLTLSILYRGPLASCDYDCWYCPFAKRADSAADLERDREALRRFVDWIGARSGDDRLAVLFTPWGEALVRRWYREAFAQLSHLRQVTRVAVQTNLSYALDWIDACEVSKLALWVSFHPTQIPRRKFLAKCHELYRRGVRFSVGVVGLRESFDDIEALRSELPNNVYLWINAYKDQPGYYNDDEIEWLTGVDGLFPYNVVRHASRGQECRTGQDVISVDGDGVVRRCHFVREALGNLYESDVAVMLRPRPCPNATCGCHIGYVHMPELKLAEQFGEGVLERVPLPVVGA